MECVRLFILQLIAHLLADFFFQNDIWSRHKRMHGFRSKVLYWHILITFLLSWGFSFRLSFISFSLIIAILHFLVDGFKGRIGEIKIGKKRPFRKSLFLIDQCTHILIIAIAVFLFRNMFEIKQLWSLPVTNHRLLVILGYLFCLKPSNVIIKEVFTVNNFKLTVNSNKKSDSELLDAGSLIGNIERFLTLSLLLMGQYGAIGFILAGKSILRYEGQKTAKTEYVLIGTLLSFGIAITTGILILKSGIN